MLSLILLSFVQAITEFLPISSSGHLFLLNFIGISEQGMGMDVLLHLGTLFAVLLYFREDIKVLFLSVFTHRNKQLLYQLIIGTFPIILVGCFLFNLLNDARLPVFVAINSIFWGIVLWLVDKFSSQKGDLKHLSYKHAFIIGCVQVLSLIPGTSRSGITMTCARALGISRTESARFSMLLSIPAILAAVAYVGYKGLKGVVLMPSFYEGTLAILCTTIFGLLAVCFLMKWLKKSSFGIFALYRILLGLFVLAYIIF